MDRRPLGRTGLSLSPIGYGAFKIGRNQGIKYATPYELPDDATVARLLAGLVEHGVNWFDTAPAYGTSEERLGRLLPRASGLLVSTKVGEEFADGKSTYDFSAAAVRRSLERSLKRLGRDVLDLVFVHAHGDDLAILRDTDVVDALQTARASGLVRFIGFSGKTVAAARAALSWADALMVEYHLDDTSQAEIIAEASATGVGVVAKKALASGRLPVSDALRFVLAPAGIASAAVSSLSLERMLANLQIAKAADIDNG
jgi:aryl-alcohol dehydrogenase-like predicted oxidoreductase